MSTTPAGRLARLEDAFRSRRCQTCYGWPVRTVWADPETRIPWYETLPETGCPECGAPIRMARRVLIPDDGTGEPPIWRR